MRPAESLFHLSPTDEWRRRAEYHSRRRGFLARYAGFWYLITLLVFLAVVVVASAQGVAGVLKDWLTWIDQQGPFVILVALIVLLHVIWGIIGLVRRFAMEPLKADIERAFAPFLAPIEDWLVRRFESEREEAAQTEYRYR